MRLKNASLDQVIRNAITVTDTMNLLEAREVLLKHHVGRMPVLNSNKKPVGIITEKDFVRAIYKFSGKEVSKILVRDFMSKDLISIKKTDTIDRKSTRLNSSHTDISRMPSSA